MFVYTLRRINLFVITLLILTLVGYSLVRLDSHSAWAQADYFSGWYHYLLELLQLNFGVNQQGLPINDELMLVFPATLELCVTAFVVSLLIGLPVGVLAGMKPGKWQDTVISFLSMAGSSAPVFWIAMLLIMTFSLHLEFFPVSGRYNLLYEIPNVTGFATIDALLSDSAYRMAAFYSVLRHMVLPVVVLALFPTMQMIILIRNSVTDVMKNNYIRVARIRGLSNLQIIVKHVLHNAIPPVLPKIGAQLSSMMALVFVTESIFNWPGIGRWLLDALFNRDFQSIQAGVMVVASVVLTANILSELLAVLINPRMRNEWYAAK